MSEKFYMIGLRKKTAEKDRFYFHEDFQFKEVKIGATHKYWFADPFIFEKDGIVYLFYEAFDLIKQCGSIGYSIIKEDGSASKPNIIIKGTHKSFPYIFENSEGIFIMPESCADNNIKLFKAVNFPDEWKEECILLEDNFAVDSILINHKNRTYLLASEQYRNPPKGKVISCWVKNCLYEFPDNLTKGARNINGYMIAEGEDGIRNAGAIFKSGCKYIRPGQNCKNGVYGMGLKFFEIESFVPYKENMIYEIDCEQMQSHVSLKKGEVKLVGTHTYNSSDHYEVIDLSYWSRLTPTIFLGRKIYHGLRKCYHGMIKIGLLADKAIKKIYRTVIKKEETYKAIVNENAPWVFVSYIAAPFYHSKDSDYLADHQNKREVLAMADVFNKLGYNAYFMLYTSKKSLPDMDCKLVFGHEPNIQRAKEKYSDAKMIYYGVSTYFDYRNHKIQTMTDEFNNNYGAHIPYRRTVTPHESIKDADEVLLIGSDQTIKTYPEEYRGKVSKIHQSTQMCKFLKNVEASGTKDFFYLASSGNILKGVYPIIEYFSHHTEYELHWVGPIENDVYKAIKDRLTTNIHTYGYQNIGSNFVLELMRQCDFTIYPSGVEGVPGAVLNAMKNGLIPLVTPWASFDGIEDYGFLMEDTTLESVESAVNWAMALSKEEIDRRKRACQKFVLENYNLDQFTKEFEEYMKRQLT